MKHRATVALLMRDSEVLLARKKKKLGRGLWNGYGGFEEEGDETLEDTALREMQEEIGVFASPHALEKIGIISYSNQNEDGRRREVEVHFYIVHEWEGEPKGGEEMDTPTWFPVDDLPVQEMMPTDRTWLPRALRGERFIGVVRHGKNKEILSSEFKTVSSF